VKQFFAPNISRSGRWWRVLFALVLAATGVALLSNHRAGALFLFGFAAFALFEAARGWCIVRACGIKTKY
jgi:uncharacterized membrane protein YhhN